MSVMSTTFNALAMNITFLREEGVLKRIHGTPMPPTSYLGGVTANAVSNAFVQVVIVVLAGRLFFGIGWPKDWLELVVFAFVGVATLAALGVAFSHVIPNFDAAPAYTNIVFLPVIFISGVFYDVDTAPRSCATSPRSLPLTHIIDGLSAALVTGESLADNVGNLAVVAAWGLFGAVFAVRGFSWQPSATDGRSPRRARGAARRLRPHRGEGSGGRRAGGAALGARPGPNVGFSALHGVGPTFGSGRGTRVRGRRQAARPPLTAFLDDAVGAAQRDSRADDLVTAPRPRTPAAARPRPSTGTSASGPFVPVGAQHAEDVDVVVVLAVAVPVAQDALVGEADAEQRPRRAHVVGVRVGAQRGASRARRRRGGRRAPWTRGWRPCPRSAGRTRCRPCSAGRAGRTR